MSKTSILSALSAAALLFVLFACAVPPPDATPAPMAVTSTGSTSNCLAPPAVTSTTPADMKLPRQADANCFAWQEFLSLSWVASSSMRGQPDTSIPASKFGTPLDSRPAVWETYKESDQVFLPDATNPGPWNSPIPAVKTLGGLKSKFDADPPLDLSEVAQAVTGGWLTAQNGMLTLYDRRMNEDEYNYVVQNGLYNAVTQQTFAVSPGMNLPDGTAATSQYGPLGAIETKAAWIELPDPKDWPRYKIARANVCYPANEQELRAKTCSVIRKNVVVGLVGLHIIHKTALGQQFIWATFEHVDNAPNQSAVSAGTVPDRPYMYFNPKCNPATDFYQCKANVNPLTVPNAPLAAPNQVVRTIAIPSRPNDDVTGLNQYAWSQIRAANPQSVYLNYQLVNVLWSNQNTFIQPGARTPLIAAQMSPGPSQEPVANTTLETYVQSVTCITCHANAPIATVTPPPSIRIEDPAKAGTPATAQNPYAADYSFLLDNATQASANKGNQ